MKYRSARVDAVEANAPRRRIPHIRATRSSKAKSDHSQAHNTVISGSKESLRGIQYICIEGMADVRIVDEEDK